MRCVPVLSLLAPVSNQSVSYQGRRDSLQWASFPETSRVFSFSAGMLILIKVEEMFHNTNFTLNFTHSVSWGVCSALVEPCWYPACCCSVWALGAMSVSSRHVTICWYLVLRRSFCSACLTFLWNVQFCWLFQLVNKRGNRNTHGHKCQWFNSQ